VANDRDALGRASPRAASRPLPQPSLKGRALRLLSTREHSRFELERKLKPHEPAPGVLAAVLDELQAKGFIDEQRVLESLIHRRSAKLGVARIKQELQGKGLEAAAVQRVVASLQASELARALEVWRKKFGRAAAAGGSVAAPDPAERGRQMRFLASRGFGGDTIRRVLSGGLDDRDPTGS
jgi:regulatory protein